VSQHVIIQVAVLPLKAPGTMIIQALDHEPEL
jgi:hypothetical protein